MTSGGTRIGRPDARSMIAQLVRARTQTRPSLPVPWWRFSGPASRSEPESVQVGGLPRGARDDELFRFLLALTRGGLDPQEAYTLWEREDRPRRERYGITVSGERAWAWLDDPAGPYVWQLPDG